LVTQRHDVTKRDAESRITYNGVHIIDNASEQRPAIFRSKANNDRKNPHAARIADLSPIANGSYLSLAVIAICFLRCELS
jgi:hypothetical protein